METTTTEREILPTNVKPVACDLLVIPDIEAGTFSGTATYRLDVLEGTTAITVNAKGLSIKASVSQGGETQEAIVTYDEKRSQATFTVERALEAGNPAELRLMFEAPFHDGLVGFYRSSYEQDGVKRFMATTQFEPGDARRMFPCWDEPGIKAPYRISAIVPDDLAAISNGRVVETTLLDEGKKLVEFEATPVMSTYLIALIVGDLTYISATTADGIEVRGWTTPGKQEQCRFAVDLTVQALPMLADYFGVPYAFSKVDLLAIPDFEAGAMENWAVITFRETSLLIDPENSSQGALSRVSITTVHELVHQWFGNLVTMFWWDDLWLNESFATWLATKILDRIHPEWNLWSQFIVEEMVGGMELDGLATSHPVSVPVAKMEDAGQNFDAITYNKGGSVLRMLEQHLGEEAFRQGMQLYMQRHKFGNARAADLWNALGEAAHEPGLVAMMESWIMQMGYPMIDVSSEPTSEGSRLQIRQSKFRYAPDSTDKTLWDIPIGIVVGGKGGRGFALPARLDAVQASVGLTHAPGAWIHLNAGRTGFYRVNYSTDGWRALIEAVTEGSGLTTEECFGLQDDAFALSLSGATPVTTFLDMAQAFRNMKDFAVWNGLASNLHDAYGLVASHDEARKGFEQFARELFAEVVAHVGWDPKPGDGHSEILLRATVLGEAGRYGDAAVLAEARTRFEDLLKGKVLDPNLRGVVYSLAARSGGESEYEELVARYRTEKLPEEKMRLLGSLAWNPSADMLGRTLAFSLSSDVRTQDAVRVIGNVAAHPYGVSPAWQFLKDRWEELAKTYAGSFLMLSKFLDFGTKNLGTSEELEDVRAFFAARSTEGVSKRLAQSLERIGINIAWAEKNRDDLIRRYGA